MPHIFVIDKGSQTGVISKKEGLGLKPMLLVSLPLNTMSADDHRILQQRLINAQPHTRLALTRPIEDAEAFKAVQESFGRTLALALDYPDDVEVPSDTPFAVAEGNTVLFVLKESGIISPDEYQAWEDQGPEAVRFIVKCDDGTGIYRTMADISGRAEVRDQLMRAITQTAAELHPLENKRPLFKPGDNNPGQEL